MRFEIQNPVGAVGTFDSKFNLTEYGISYAMALSKVM